MRIVSQDHLGSCGGRGEAELLSFAERAAWAPNWPNLSSGSTRSFGHLENFQLPVRLKRLVERPAPPQTPNTIVFAPWMPETTLASPPPSAAAPAATNSGTKCSSRGCAERKPG